ncbi:restriction endonuclease subunit S [Clostridium sp. ZBS15]|uniref:restriction endonuclease subunit S n=1 Tax=Clostridium sp. ZBS15 TaxID=2949969 RepID=UPI00207AFB1B|nr:restriction endonuclease subunit S [Clostridium sp. ZBS15]
MIRNTIELGRIAEFRNGVNYNKDNFGIGIKVINVADFKDYFRPKYEELGEINPEGVVSNDSILQKNDIIFVRSNGNKELIGRTLFIDEDEKNIIYSAFCIRCRFIDPEIEPKFYAYLFKTNFIRRTLTAQGNGTNISNLNQGILNKLQVPKLPKAAQQKIVKFLSPYDDLIENNLKRINLLEESAEILYKEWFVNFRFPGCESQIDSNGIPQGWNNIEVRQFGDVITGKTPSTKKSEYYGGYVKFIKTPDMNNSIYVINTNQTLTDEGAKSQENKYVPKNSILVSCIGTVGIVSLTSEISQFNQQINALVPFEKEYIYYLYFKFKSLKELLEGLGSSGATMANVNKGKFETIKILNPDKKVIKMFYDKCDVIFKQILNLQHANEKLTEARDILIPKLITGEIEV